jgi:hypothetical protein
MAEIPEWLTREVAGLRQMRDEMKLQAHLGKADAKDAWEDVEKRWQHLEGRLRVLRDASKEEFAEVADAAKLLIEEIRRGYQHVKKLV